MDRLERDFSLIYRRGYFGEYLPEIKFLISEVKRLKEGIKKHKKDKQNMIRQAHAPNSGSYLDPWDKELYKLVEGK